MKALINITTSAGKSLEEFPKEITTDSYNGDFLLHLTVTQLILVFPHTPDPTLITTHKGDKITIEILED